jgi:hypothetical protein
LGGEEAVKVHRLKITTKAPRHEEDLKVIELTSQFCAFVVDLLKSIK